MAGLKFFFISVLTALLGAFFSSCESGESPDPSPPILSIVPVAIDQTVAIIPFGEDLTPNQKNPAFEYILNSDTIEVIASANGVVTKILNNQGVADFEIHIKPTQSSKWTLIYDHVLEVTVVEGETIEAGDILGKVGVGNRTELQLNSGSGEATLSNCPMDFGTESFVNLHFDYFETWCLTTTVIP